MRQITNPASGRRGARNTDLVGTVIGSENILAPTNLQMRHVARRYRLTPNVAALIADFAFDNGRRA
jgi:hypothetical protein